MTAEEINQKMERGVFGSHEIKKLGVTQYDLGRPSDPNFTDGVDDSVSRQALQVEAAWDATTKKLTITRNAGGNGYWIPYLGTGAPDHGGAFVPLGKSRTHKRGFGTYTPPVVPGGAISWVATGPFSSCHCAVVPTPTGRVFGHLITPAAGYTADSIDNQMQNIQNEVGGAPGTEEEVPRHNGEGFVFWTFINNVWYQRYICAANGVVSWVGKKKVI